MKTPRIRSKSGDADKSVQAFAVPPESVGQVIASDVAVGPDITMIQVLEATPDGTKEIQHASCTTENGITTYTKADWLAEGRIRFGTDFMKWKFVCPDCHNVAAVIEFGSFKDRGAEPNSATCECIGRYQGGNRTFSSDEDPQKRAHFIAGKPDAPCDYAGYGLLRLSPVRVIQENGKETHCFAFAEGR